MDERRSEHRSYFLPIAVAACLLPVIYVLSFGPYLWLRLHDYVPVVDWIYKPLVDAAGRSSLINQLLGWYLGLFTGE